MYNIDNQEKRDRELKPLKTINDSFKKIVIVKDNFKPWIDEEGIYYISLKDFILNEDIIEK